MTAAALELILVTLGHRLGGRGADEAIAGEQLVDLVDSPLALDGVRRQQLVGLYEWMAGSKGASAPFSHMIARTRNWAEAEGRHGMFKERRKALYTPH